MKFEFFPEADEEFREVSRYYENQQVRITSNNLYWEEKEVILMPMSLEEIFSEAKILPNDSRAILAEKLVASIEDDIDPLVTKIHLDEVKKRRNEIRSGKIVPINGEEGLAQVRAMIEK